MNNLQLFKFEERNVEILEIGKQIFFNPRHIGNCLGIDEVTVRRHIQNMSDKQVRLLKNSDVQDMNIRILNNAGENFLTESGVYKLIFKSRMPAAEKVQDWIADEVLPEIRKTGQYLGEQKAIVQTNEKRALEIFECRTKVAMLMEIPKHLALTEVVKMTRKETGIDYEPLLLQSPAMDNIKPEEEMLEPTELSKLMRLSPRTMNRFLVQCGLQEKVSGRWTPTKNGEQYSMKHAWTKGTKSGYNYKWNVSAILVKWKQALYS